MPERMQASPGMPPQPRHGAPPPGHDEAVSPVIGTVLLLGIFAAAILATLLASGPLLDRLQGQTAAQGMVGDLVDVRDASLALAGPDSARTVSIVNPKGVLGVGAAGGMLLVYDTNQDGGLTCDFRITDWDDTTSGALAFTTTGCPAANAGGCAAGVCVDAARVLGGAVQPVVSTSNAATLTLPSDTLGDDDWRFRLVDSTGMTEKVYAEAWLVRSDAVHWGDDKTGASADEWLGFVFSHREGTTFADRPFPFETQDGGEMQVVRLVSMHADTPGATTQTGPHQLRLRLADRSLRGDLDGSTLLATHIRFEFTGRLAAEACYAMDLRDLTPGSGQYVPDVALPCSGSLDIHAVAYDLDDAAPATDSFPLEVSHARVRAELD